jgi:hypothetical protein
MTALTKSLKHDRRLPAPDQHGGAPVQLRHDLAWGWRWRSLCRSRRACARAVLLGLSASSAVGRFLCVNGQWLFGSSANLVKAFR